MRQVFSFLCLLVSVIVSSSISISGQAILLKNASVIDGSGKAAFRADLRIVKDKIDNIGKIKPNSRDKVIDASGLILAPGFIDIHNHSESGLLINGTADNQVSQGITTLFVGPDGGSPESIADYLSALNGNIALNVGAFMGHGTLRELVMKENLARQANENEIAQMSALLEKAMREGAFGLSSGLEYDAGYSASTEELISLSSIASKFGGIYMTHIRDEEEGLLDSIREAIRIGREAKIPVQISHIKAGNRNVWGISGEAIKIIEESQKAGFDVTADAYPYTAWASTITVLVPSRKHEDQEEIAKGIRNVGGADKVLITSCAAHRDFEGKTLAEISTWKNVSPEDVYVQIVKDGGAGVVCNSMNEEDVKNFYQQPWVMVSSDGGIGGRHPRATGTFPRVLGKFVRENQWFSLPEAIRKMTSAPAKRLGLKNRGTIRKGAIADLVLFDSSRIIDNATFAEPQRFASGIERVWVNGVLVWENGKSNGNLPGKVLIHKK